MKSNVVKKMQKALDKIIVITTEWQGSIPFGEVRKIAKAARKLPLRNCDRFADELDTQLAFLNEVWLISIDRETMTEQYEYDNWTDEMRKRYGIWLFAPAAEQKGDRL